MSPNFDAALLFVQVMRDLGRVEPIDQARVTAFLELARAVDLNPAEAGLWKQYREAERELREADDGNDALSDLFAALRDAPNP